MWKMKKKYWGLQSSDKLKIYLFFYIYSFSRRFYTKRLTIEEYNNDTL